MKFYWKSVLPICLIIGLQACGNTDRKGRDEAAGNITDSLSDSTRGAQVVTADVNLNGDGKVFALSAATGGLMEVEAAALALKKSKNKEVKDFAEQMLKDHGAANAELEKIANAKGLNLTKTLPDALAGHLADMNTLADRAFDVQYIRMMVKDHQNTVNLFTEGSRLADAELKAFAVKTLPVIQRHYQTATELGDRLNISNANNGDDVLGLSPAKIDKK